MQDEIKQESELKAEAARFIIAEHDIHVSRRVQGPRYGLNLVFKYLLLRGPIPIREAG